ncbi:MAG: NAD(P)/FAD-dependent oxidoreductase, partial [Gemmiger sp.]
KLLITGKGRCNVTSDSDVRDFLPYVRHNARFLYSSLYAFPPSAAMELFESLGVPLKTERGRRVFPCSDRAADVLAALRAWAAPARILRAHAGGLLLENGVCTGVIADGQPLRAANVLVATGGISYPATGSDGSGYRLARQAGHTIVEPQPSLCSLVSPDPACREMMGLALRNVRLTLLCDGRPVFTEQGEALFTHFGLSGPLVLSASTYIDEVAAHRYVCEFDLKPALDEKTLYDRLTRDFAALGGHSAQGALEKLLPHSMRPVAVRKWGVDPALRAAQITREQKQALVTLCKHWPVPVSALGDREHAVITAGGVDTREVDPKTMQSRLCPHLYFAGEVLDVDARTGGYNLQIAWSTAQAAVRHLEI